MSETKGQVRTLGGELKTDQDVTIILTHKVEYKENVVGTIYLHKHVLSTHSTYCEALANKSHNGSMELVFAVHTGVKYYFDCFSSMYSPSAKSFKGVEHGVELLKVASQIEYRGLMHRVSLYLSSMLWSKEDEIRVWKYSASPGFPSRRPELGALVARLGLDESEGNSRKQLYSFVSGVLKVSGIPNALTNPAFLQAIGNASPSDYSRKVFEILIQAAKDMAINIGEECNSRSLRYPRYASVVESILTLFRILACLLKNQLAEELVQTIVPLNAIPRAIIQNYGSASVVTQLSAEVVLVMYKEVVAGRLVLKAPTRVALLTHWHELMKSSLKVGTFEQAAADLFLTLPLKWKAEFLESQSGRVSDVISLDSLTAVL